MAVIAERTVKSTDSLSENFAVSLSNMEGEVNVQFIW